MESKKEERKPSFKKRDKRRPRVEVAPRAHLELRAGDRCQQSILQRRSRLFGGVHNFLAKYQFLFL